MRVRRFISLRRSESGIIPKGTAPLTEKGRDEQHIVCSKLLYRLSAQKLERRINGRCDDGAECPAPMERTTASLIRPRSDLLDRQGLNRAEHNVCQRSQISFSIPHAERDAGTSDRFCCIPFFSPPKADRGLTRRRFFNQPSCLPKKKPPTCGAACVFPDRSFSALSSGAPQARGPQARSGPGWYWHRFANGCRSSKFYAAGRA